MDQDLRRYFDEQLETVLSKLPKMVHEALEEVPLIVEDYPPTRIMREMEIEHRDELQGLYVGRDRFESHGDGSPEFPDSIYLFREGICALAADDNGEIDEAELREQIRVTIMHEVGHYYGLDEDDLERHGYE